MDSRQPKEGHGYQEEHHKNTRKHQQNQSHSQLKSTPLKRPEEKNKKRNNTTTSQSKLAPSAIKDCTNSLSFAVHQMGSSRSEKVYDAAVNIRKRFIKDPKGVARFRELGGLDKILSIVKESSNYKLVDVSLSILGNCCMEDATRKQVLAKGGIDIIAKLLQQSEVESIQNRTSRILGNLAQDVQCCSVIHDLEQVVPLIVNFLKNTENTDCQQTYVRTLRLLGDTPVHQRAVLDCDGLKEMADLLKSNVPEVVIGGMKAVMEFTKLNVTVDHARQLVMADTAESLLRLISVDHDSISQTAKSLLLTYVKHDNLRPSIGSAGGVCYFLDNIQSDYEVFVMFEEDTKKEKDQTEPPKIKIPQESKSKPKAELLKQRSQKRVNSLKEKLSMVNALCMCCNESVNRLKVREAGGLELILKLLQEEPYQLIHNRMISALVCFLYDDSGLQILLKNGMVSMLSRHLRRVAKLGPETEIDFTVDVLDFNQFDHEIIEGVSKVDPYQNKAIQDDEIMTEKKQISSAHADIDCKAPDESGKNCNKETTKNRNIIMAENKIDESIPNEQIIMDFSLSEPGVGSVCDCDANNMTCKHGKVQVDSKDPLSLGINEQRTRPKYSIDSPTYQEVSEFQMEEDYFKGPKNIMESDQSCFNRASSPELSPPSSPYRGSPYSSPPKSPIGIHRSSSSPALMGHLGSTSPSSSTDSTFNMDREQMSPAPCSPIRIPPSPQWSPQQPLSPKYDVYASPEYIGSYQDAPAAASPWWYGGEVLQYSSEEDEDESEKQMVPNISESKIKEKDKEKASTSDAVLDDLMPSSEFSDSEFLGFAIPGDVVSETPELKKVTKGRKRKLSQSSPSNSLDKCKKCISTNAKKKILEVVESNKRLSIDLDTILTSPASGIRTDSVTSDPESEKLENDEMLLTRNPSKMTEQNILTLLSRISYHPSASQYLVNHNIWSCLTDYVMKANDPLSRGGRILLRMTKDPDCFERLVKAMLPSYVCQKLTMKDSSTKSLLDGSSNADKETKIYPKNVKANASLPNRNICVSKESVLRTSKESSTLNEAVPSTSKESSTLNEAVPSTSKESSALNEAVPSTSKESSTLNEAVPCTSKESSTLNEAVPITSKESSTLNEAVPITSKESSALNEAASISADVICDSYILRVYQLREALLSHLTLMAEGAYGRGVLAHLILSGSKTLKMKAVIATALLCRSKILMKKMFLEYPGVDLFCDAFLNSSDKHLQNHSIISLSHMLKHVHLKWPPQLQNVDTDLQKHFIWSKNPPAMAVDLIFEMDDGMEVKGQRSILVARSPVFEAMLEGHYAESSQSKIRIQDVNSQAFQLLIAYLHGYAKKNIIIRSISLGDQIEILLDAIALADRYMLPELLVWLENWIAAHSINLSTLVHIFNTAILHSCEWLAKQCLVFIGLVQDVTTSKRLEVMQDLMKNPTSANALKTILKSIISGAIA